MLGFSEKLISESVVVARGSGFGRSDHPPDFKSLVSACSTTAACFMMKDESGKRKDNVLFHFQLILMQGKREVKGNLAGSRKGGRRRGA